MRKPECGCGFIQHCSSAVNDMKKQKDQLWLFMASSESLKGLLATDT